MDIKTVNLHNVSFGQKHHRNIAVPVAAGLIAMSSIDMNAQEIPTNQNVIKEFKAMDKDENLKINTIEFLQYFTKDFKNPKELQQKTQEGLDKFNAADSENDSELNIDEYRNLAQNKISIKKAQNTSPMPEVSNAAKIKRDRRVAELGLPAVCKAIAKTRKTNIEFERSILLINKDNIIEVCNFWNKNYMWRNERHDYSSDYHAKLFKHIEENLGSDRKKMFAEIITSAFVLRAKEDNCSKECAPLIIQAKNIAQKDQFPVEIFEQLRQKFTGTNTDEAKHLFYRDVEDNLSRSNTRRYQPH